MTPLADRLRLVQLPLEAALAAVRVAIEQRRDGRDTLGVAGTAVRQLRGVMRVVDCMGGWLLLDEAMQSLHALGEASGPAGSPEALEPALQALSAATIELARYLEYLREGGVDQVLLLREAINALRRTRAAPELGLLDLGARVLATVPADASSSFHPTDEAAADPDANQAVAARTRIAPIQASFQAAFLRWFRDPADEAARAELGDLAGQLATAATPPALRESLLAIAGALADRLEPDTEAEARRLVGRAVMWLRALAAVDGAGVDPGLDPGLDPGEDRLRLLALLAFQAQTPARQARPLREDLCNRLRPLHTLAAARQRFQRPDALTRRRFGEEVARELAAAREAIDLAVRADADAADAAGEDIARRLEGLVPIFVFDDRPQAAQVLRDAAARVRRPGALRADAADEATDLATELLALEHEPDQAPDAAPDVATGAATATALVGPRPFSLAEARVALAGVARRELARLRQAFEQADEPKQSPTPAQAAAWMRTVCVAGEWLGDEALQSELRQWSAQWSAAWPGHALPLEQRLHLAESLAAVELWFEALERPCAVIEAPSVLLQRCLAAAETAAGTAAGTEAGPQRAAPEGEPVFAGDDAELRAIFIAEAADWWPRLRQALERWRQRPEAVEAPTELRRGFHTLKGAARLVGADALADRAITTERRIAGLLDGTASVRPELLDGVAAAIDQAESWLQTWQPGTPPSKDQPPSADESLEPEFRRDAVERLKVVAHGLEAGSAASEALREESMRALHTLQGGARLLGLDALGSIFDTLERVIRRGGAQSFGEGQRERLQAVVDALWHGLEDSARPDAWDALADRLREIEEALPAAEPAFDPQRLLDALGRLREAEDRALPAEASAADLPAAARELHSFGDVMVALSAPAMAEAAHALAARLEAVREPGAALFCLLPELFEALYRRLDRQREGFAEEDPAPLLDRIAGLPVAVPAGRPAPSVPVAAPPASAPVDAELGAVFQEEAAEWMAALWDAEAAGPFDGEAVSTVGRGLHTLRGSARIAGFEAVADLASRLEAAFREATEPAAFWSQLRPGLAALCGLLDLPVSSTSIKPVSAPDETEAPGAPADDGANLSPAADAVREEPPPPAPDAEAVSGEGESSWQTAAAASTAASPDDDRSLRELRAVFAEEAAELIETVHQALDACERGAAEAGLSELRHALHTLKGSARMVGEDALAGIAHDMESRLAQVPADAPGNTPDAALLAALRLDADRLLPPSAAIAVGAEDETTPDAAASAEAPSQPTEHARVAVAELDRLLDRAAEAGILRSRVERHVHDLRGQLGELALAVSRARDQLRALEGESEARLGARRRSAHAAARYGEDEFDPLEMDRYTRLQELSRALAETTSDLGALRTTLDGEVAGMEGLLRRQARVQGEVRDGLTAALMVPLSRQVPRLMRLVRRLAEAQGRQAVLEVDGAGTGLDRTVLDRLMPALEHLLRNAVVHGIEPPAQRQARGKGEVGRIRLRVRRDGARLTLSLSDDGAGLDSERIRRRAVEIGRLADGQAVDRAQLTRLLFEPGFSTAAQVSADAGRGIGLDIVASTLRALGGEIAVEGEPGIGTTFHLRLPLNLTLTQTLLVTVGAERYALPLGIVTGVMRLSAEEVARRLAEGDAGVRYGDEDYSLRPLVDVVEGQADPAVSGMRSLVLVRIADTVAASGQRVALLVDRLLGQREILLRPPGPQLAAVPGIVGATLLADGEIALLLDLPGLLTPAAVAAAPAPQAVEHSSPLVMVVDDSVTVRRFTERLLRQNGYRVLTARDGAEAIALLDGERPDAMLLDIEMPRVDGFEVAQFVREQPRLAGLPLIVITSRSGDKHRSRAEALGVQAYLTKPYGDALLLAELARALESRDD